MVKNTVLTIEASTGTAFQYKGVKPTDDIRYCNCGCNLQVVKKAIYRPGHDARHVSQIALVIEDLAATTARSTSISKAIREGFEALPSPRLMMKLATRLYKTLGEKYADAVTRLLGDAIIEDDEAGDE